MRQRSKLHWSKVVCRPWAIVVYNVEPTLGQRRNAIWDRDNTANKLLLTTVDMDCIEYCKFVNLPREKLFDSIIRNMQKRLMDSNHLLTRKSDEGSNLLHELIHLVEPHSWNI